MTRVIFTREQMRAYDAFAIEACAVPGVVLMENAGRGAANVISEQGTFGPVIVVCGTGNNGGDGLVVARHLLARGIYAEVVLLGAPGSVRGDAKLNLDALVGLGGRVTVVDDDDLESLDDLLETATLIVDAIFGTGLSRALQGRFAAAVEAINDCDAVCIALDIPSGIDADTGQILGVAVRADATVAFGHHKAGLFQSAGITHAGKVLLMDLGIPDAAIVQEVGYSATLIDPDDVLGTLGKRAADSHKYRAGSVLVVAGSEGKLGAALLVARGVLRGGAGVATIGTWPSTAAALSARVDEAMTLALDPQDLDASLARAYARRAAVALGPGLGTDASARKLCETVAIGFEGPAVIDADAITCFAGRAKELRKAKGPRVLTPHAGELARLLGTTSEEIEAHRFAAARAASEETGCCVVLKGAHSVIAGEGPLQVCAEGHAALGTAGSGDVLTGVMAAMMCQLPATEAACAAVLLHARTAEQWVARTGADRGMLAGEIADGIPAAIASLSASSQE